MIKASAAFALVVVLLVGCGDASRTGATGASPDAPVTAAASPSPGAGSGPREVRPEGGLENPTPSAWEDAEVLDGGRAARLIWYSGVEECYGLDHVEVDYGEDKVTVTLYAGARASKKPCIELAEQVVTTVRFDEPLGDRKLVDGSQHAD